MNRDIAKRWVAALRSGKFNQTTGRLHRTRRQDSIPAGYCCLGVLCELAVADGVIPPGHVSEQGGRVSYGPYGDINSADLPLAVRNWAGMRHRSGAYGVGESLASDNDGGLPFTAIAHVIESHVDEL